MCYNISYSWHWYAFLTLIASIDYANSSCVVNHNHHVMSPRGQSGHHIMEWMLEWCSFVTEKNVNNLVSPVLYLHKTLGFVTLEKLIGNSKIKLNIDLFGNKLLILYKVSAWLSRRNLHLQNFRHGQLLPNICLHPTICSFYYF